MNDQTRMEVIKALARGNSQEVAAKITGVSVDEVLTVTQEEINEGKERLRKWRGT